jgi:hypothetical protein
MARKIAVAGAGIYGTTAAIRLAEQGHHVSLFDPLGIMRAASAINQCRIHAGYHYPRSPETIAEIAEASSEFVREFAAAIVKNTRHYYAIPREDSRTSPTVYEEVMARHSLPLQRCRPDWLNFDFIESCYAVEEQLYDPEILRNLIEARIRTLPIRFEQRAFTPEMRNNYDFVIWATYGLGASHELFSGSKRQVAEKVLVEFPAELQGLAVVVVDGPFTAFDSYGNSGFSLFGSAKHTNHWSSTDANEPIPERYSELLNCPTFEPVAFTRFDEMRTDCSLAIPLAERARYLGSRFTIRVVENSPDQDRRTLYVAPGAPGEFHIFSGKVVSAVKAARLICEAIDHEA